MGVPLERDLCKFGRVRVDSSGTEEGICSRFSGPTSCTPTPLALSPCRTCVCSAFLVILMSSALILLEGGFKLEVPRSSTASAPLMVYSCGLTFVLVRPSLLATTRPSLSSLVLLLCPEEAGENRSFCFCTADAVTGC